MRIIVKRSGGFAGPLLNKKYEIKSESLSPAEENKLNSLPAAVPEDFKPVWDLIAQRFQI